jgi:hypothetical protein
MYHIAPRLMGTLTFGHELLVEIPSSERIEKILEVTFGMFINTKRVLERVSPQHTCDPGRMGRAG